MSRVRRVVSALAAVVGWIAIVVLADAAIGSLWPGGEDSPRTESGSGPAPVGIIERDARADSPALDAAPWAETMYAELAALQFRYTPYRVAAMEDFEGATLNVRDGVRRSYVPEPPGSDPVTIWFFGGSTMFGEGQRDEHTIPSQVARTLEAQGLPVVVENLGQQGFTAWQELLLFEARVADRPAPDIVVFYDGANEFNAQVEDPSGQPTHLDRDLLASRFEEQPPLPGALAASPESWWQRYQSTSASGQLWSRLVGLTGRPAAAGAAGSSVDELVDRTVSAYRRAVDIGLDLAERNDVEPVFIWQPVTALAAWQYNEIGPTLPPPVIDLSGALVGRDDVFIDGSHTNEVGAELVGAEIARLLAPIIRERAGESPG